MGSVFFSFSIWCDTGLWVEGLTRVKETDLLIIWPESNPPTAQPTVIGRRCVAASALVAY